MHGQHCLQHIPDSNNGDQRRKAVAQYAEAFTLLCASSPPRTVMLFHQAWTSLCPVAAAST